MLPPRMILPLILSLVVLSGSNLPAAETLASRIDAQIQAESVGPSAAVAGDAEFLRRVSLDLTGLPSTGDQVKTFLNDPRESRVKRLAKIDELLESPNYVDHWTH